MAAACMILLRCISRQASSCRSGNWKSPNFMGWGNWKAIRSMSRGMSSSAAAAPWLMLPPSLEDKTMCYNLYSPVDKKVTTRVSNRRSSITTSIGGGGGDKEEELDEIRLESAVLAGSSHGWLAVYKDWYNFDDLFLYNPISDRHIKLPPIKTIPLAGAKFGNDPQKLIISESNASSNSCRAVLRYGPRCQMAVCCPGLSAEWTPFGDPFHEGEELNHVLAQPRIVRCYDDFVYSTRRQQLFCVTEYGDLEAWDIRDPSSPKLIWKTNDDDMDHDEKYPWPPGFELVDEFKQTCPTLKYLVFSEHSDRLFLVRRYLLESENCKVETMDFNVYEIIIRDTGGGELRYMKGSLDGMAFFIGEEATDGLVVESPGALNLLPDSIYFTDRIEVRTPSYWDGYGGHHLVVFDHANKTFSPCHLPGLDVPPKRENAPPPLWFTLSPSITTPLSNE